jgi:hypothetical protein
VDSQTVTQVPQAVQHPLSSTNRHSELTPANRRALLKAHLWLCVKKLGRGQSIEEGEIIALLPLTESAKGGRRL